MNNINKWFRLLLVAPLIILTGCAGTMESTPLNDPKWTFHISHYAYSDKTPIYARDEVKIEDGHWILALRITITNVHASDQTLVSNVPLWYTTDGNGHSGHPLLANDEINIPFSSGESKSSYLFLQVPKDFSISTATLIIHYYENGQDRTVIVDLSQAQPLNTT